MKIDFIEYQAVSLKTTPRLILGSLFVMLLILSACSPQLPSTDPQIQNTQLPDEEEPGTAEG
jgi:hypothetical protein